MTKRKLAVLLFLFGLFLPLSYASAGVVIGAYKYAWSDNVGYINFGDVYVDASRLTGYAWSENAGWIKMNPENGGVFNDGRGNLSGSAWGEQLGWIDFDNVSIITSSGKFSGTASGSSAGTITFDCQYCDVRSDWKILAFGGGGGAVGFPSSASTPAQSLPPVVVTHNEPIAVVPGQSGTFFKDTATGQVKLEIPSTASTSQATFFIDADPPNAFTEYLIPDKKNLINSRFYDVYAKDANGNPVTSFAAPVKVTLPIQKNLRSTKNLSVYWLNETNQQWALIPDAVFTLDKVTFKVSHLSQFAIFAPKDVTVTSTKLVLEPSLPLSEAGRKYLQKKNAAMQPKVEKSLIKKVEEFLAPITDGVGGFMSSLKALLAKIAGWTVRR